MLLLFVLQVPGAGAQAPPWRQTLERLQQSSETIFNRLDETRSALIGRTPDNHAQWQRAVAEYPAYFRKNNKLLAKLREMEALEGTDGTEALRARLRAQVERDLATFWRAPGLAVVDRKGGARVLPVTVCTDIGDDAFLRAFDGDPGDPYGVALIEWTGLADGLMGNPSGGLVDSEMIEMLIAAY